MVPLLMAAGGGSFPLPASLAEGSKGNLTPRSFDQITQLPDQALLACLLGMFTVIEVEVVVVEVVIIETVGFPL